MIVIDPVLTDTAEMADFHLRVRPGTDAWCLAALAAVLVQEDLVDDAFLAEHVTGAEPVRDALRAVPVADYAERCGVDEELIRARRAGASPAPRASRCSRTSAIQQAPNSTLCSYLNKLLWILTGNFAKPGGACTCIRRSRRCSRHGGGVRRARRSPARRIIGGLVPCNVDRRGDPDRPPRPVPGDDRREQQPGPLAGRLAALPRGVRRARPAGRHRRRDDRDRAARRLRAAGREPVREARRRRSSTSSSRTTPFTCAHRCSSRCRARCPSPRSGRGWCARSACVDDEATRAAARGGRGRGAPAFAQAFLAAAATPTRSSCGCAPVRPLRDARARRCPTALRAAAALWGLAQKLRDDATPTRCGAPGHADGNALFDAILAGRSGVTFTVHEYERRLRADRATPTTRSRWRSPRCSTSSRAARRRTRALRPSDEFPLVLSAGERRAYTANDDLPRPGAGASATPTARCGSASRTPSASAWSTAAARGSPPRRGSAEATVEVSEAMLPGHASLPNGFGLSHPGEDAVRRRPQRAHLADRRDPIAGTPWHKHVPARVEAL